MLRTLKYQAKLYFLFHRYLSSNQTVWLWDCSQTDRQTGPILLPRPLMRQVIKFTCTKLIMMFVSSERRTGVKKNSGHSSEPLMLKLWWSLPLLGWKWWNTTSKIIVNVKGHPALSTFLPPAMAEEVMLSDPSVCLSVCLSVCALAA